MSAEQKIRDKIREIEADFWVAFNKEREAQMNPDWWGGLDESLEAEKSSFDECSCNKRLHRRQQCHAYQQLVTSAGPSNRNL
jgi:hypothetical protein